MSSLKAKWEAIQTERRKIERAYSRSNRDLEVRQDDVLDELGAQLGVDGAALEVGGWDCDDSPIGVCVYNHEEDRSHDDCLFCHEPEERK